MSKKKKKNKSHTKDENSKEYVVFARNPESYTSFDIRSNKPLCYKEKSLEPNAASMVLQEIEEVEFPTRTLLIFVSARLKL